MSKHGLVDKEGGGSVHLQQVTIKAKVIDFIAKVKLIQTYQNTSPSPVEAVYKFPLDGNKAVNKFVAKIDNNKIVAQVKEKLKASAVYDDAISAGKGAYLMEQNDDNMQLSIGNLPSNKSVTLIITYVQELITHGKNLITLPIPIFYYTSFDIIPPTVVQATIAMSTKILNITGHPQSTIVMNNNNTATIESNITDGNLHYKNNGVNNGEDYGIHIKVENIKPTMWVERWTAKKGKPANNDNIDPLAVMLALPPSNKFLSMLREERKEVLFVLDRSGSMTGNPTKQLQYTMYAALKVLPKNCFFNILEFGSRHFSLFQSYVPPTYENLNTARKRIAAFPKENLGGTDLLAPLKEIYNQPIVGERSIILLTDGYVNNKEETLNLVKTKSSTNSTTFVYTIGIGNVDVDLVKSLAKSGNGTCTVLDKLEGLENVMRQIMKCCFPPDYDDISITWFSVDGLISLIIIINSIFCNKKKKKQKKKKVDIKKECKSVKHAPAKLPPIYGSEIYKVFALIPQGGIIPTFVKIQGTGVSGALKMEVDATFNDTTKEIINGKLIHSVAAAQLLRELEQGAFREVYQSNRVKEEIVKLGLAYNLASTETSFVAVEERYTPTYGTMKSVDINSEGNRYIPPDRLQDYQLDCLQDNIAMINQISRDISYSLDAQNERLVLGGCEELKSACS